MSNESKERKRSWEADSKRVRLGVKSRAKTNSWTYGSYALDPRQEAFKTESCIYCEQAMQTLGERSWTPRNFAAGPDFRDPKRVQRVEICPMCGWWRTIRITIGTTPEFMISDGGLAPSEGMIGRLKPLHVADISTPLQEVRDFISANYTERFNIHPKRFEELVASVFRDLGYKAEATAYSKDRGIDVILNSGQRQIGVQVKRYKASIEVEQIRSLAGALVLRGINEGVFVTTSRFRSGATEAATLFGLRGYPIELIDADRFYDMLGIAQKAQTRSFYDWYRKFGYVDMQYLGYRMAAAEYYNAL